MTRVEEIIEESAKLEKAIDKAREDKHNPYELIQKLWHLTDELVTIKDKETTDELERRKKGDCLFD